MKVVLMHPTGNRNVRAVLAAFNRNGILARFNTTVAVNSKELWLQLLPGGVRKELLRRSFPLNPRLIKTHPVRELSRMMLPKLGFKGIVKHEEGWASVDAIYQDLDGWTARGLERLALKQNIKAVYAYEDGALATFRKAKELGLKCIYDLPIAYWETGRSLLTEEAERLPIWKVTLGGGILDSEAKLERKTLELELADTVVGPGQFVLDSLPTWASNKKIIMSPFGSPVTKLEENKQRLLNNKPLRVLFAGSMGQRKGLGDLFAAINILNRSDIELVVMGSLLAPMEFYKNELQNFIYEPGRSNEEVLTLMKTCDIFCLPSIVEGRALVMQEAMSQGLPLIITPNTGGADLIVEGKTGFLVPIRSPQAIAEKLNWFLENRSEVANMSQLAQLHASQYTWESYGSEIANSIKKTVD